MIFYYSPTITSPCVISFVGYVGDLMRVIRAIRVTSHPGFHHSFLSSVWKRWDLFINTLPPYCPYGNGGGCLEPFPINTWINWVLHSCCKVYARLQVARVLNLALSWSHWSQVWKRNLGWWHPPVTWWQVIRLDGCRSSTVEQHCETDANVSVAFKWWLQKAKVFTLVL